MFEFRSLIDKLERITESCDEDINTICMDVPLFIKLLEYARMEAESDRELHRMTENAVKLQHEGTDILTMRDYDDIVANIS